jgi:hypothetical protein
MVEAVKKGTRTIGWIILTIILSFIPTYIIGMSLERSLDELPFGYNLPFVLWGIFVLIFMVPIRRFITGRFKVQKRSAWGSPEQMRNSIVNDTKFVGRFDRGKGLLESEVRSIEHDEVIETTWASPTGVPYKVIRLRGMILDQHGSIRESVPVEIRSKREEWVGTIVEGDRIRAEGKVEDDGILHTDKVFNYSSNSIVGSRK